ALAGAAQGGPRRSRGDWRYARELSAGPQALLPLRERRVHAARQLAVDLSEHPVPVAAPGLAEEPHIRVPRTVAAFEQPAPVGHVLEGNPGRPAERPGQVRQRGVTGDDEIEIGHDRRAIEKRLRSCVVLLAEHLDWQVPRFGT